MIRLIHFLLRVDFSLMNEIEGISPHNIVLFWRPHGALRDVDPSSEYICI